MSPTWRGARRTGRSLALALAILCGPTVGARAQDSLRVRRDSIRIARDSLLVTTAIKRVQTALPGWLSPPRQDVPRDVRIMQTIVNTALSEVEPPELPGALAGDSATRSVVATRGGVVAFDADRPMPALPFYGRGDVSGFYMPGYGYLFTVSWPVGAGASAAGARVFVSGAPGAGRSPGEAGSSARERAEAMTGWAGRYRERLADALRDAIAGYGSTLRRARPGESITFLTDFGGGEAEALTMTVRADALQGSNTEANRGAVQVSRGQSGMSERLGTQLEIMSRIIDAALHSDGPETVGFPARWNPYFGGQAETQYVAGYGVIFRKNARLSTARTFADLAAPGRTDVSPDSVHVLARRPYEQHLDTLRSRTADLLATYGPTLTELEDDDWVGVFYDVGPAATLLDGTDDYLVQARMRDIRQAAARSDPAAWLAQRIVTNERDD